MPQTHIKVGSYLRDLEAKKYKKE